jgi:hypothetical protein
VDSPLMSWSFLVLSRQAALSWLLRQSIVYSHKTINEGRNLYSQHCQVLKWA